MSQSISQAITAYLQSIRDARSANTARTYGTAMNAFTAFLNAQGPPTDQTEISGVSEDVVAHFTADLKDLSPATEQLYLTAVAGFFEFLVAERLADINLARAQTADPQTIPETRPTPATVSAATN